MPHRHPVPPVGELEVVGRHGSLQVPQQPAGSTGGCQVDDPVEVVVQLLQLLHVLAGESLVHAPELSKALGVQRLGGQRCGTSGHHAEQGVVVDDVLSGQPHDRGATPWGELDQPLPAEHHQRFADRAPGDVQGHAHRLLVDLLAGAERSRQDQVPQVVGHLLSQRTAPPRRRNTGRVPFAASGRSRGTQHP